LRIETEFSHHVLHDLHMIAGLFEILLPFFLQLVVHSTAHCRLVNLYAAQLSFERLVQQFVQLFFLHCFLQLLIYSRWIRGSKPEAIRRMFCRRVNSGELRLLCEESPIEVNTVKRTGEVQSSVSDQLA